GRKHANITTTSGRRPAAPPAIKEQMIAMTKPPARQKHVPQRTCVVCRQTSAKRTLTRIVRTADQGVWVDPTGKRNGRGAYLCDQITCWERALNSDILE